MCVRRQHPAQPGLAAVRRDRGGYHPGRFVGAHRRQPRRPDDHQPGASSGQIRIGHRAGAAGRSAAWWPVGVAAARGRRGSGVGRRGVPGTARPVRRGRHDPGTARTRRGALRGRRCAGQCRRHGQGVHQEAARRRWTSGGCVRGAASAAVDTAPPGVRTAGLTGVRQTRPRRLVDRC